MWYYCRVSDYGEWIKRARRARGWSVEELSDRLRDLGYEAAPGTIRRWEGPAGKAPKARTRAALEQLLGGTAPPAVEKGDAIERIAAVMEKLADTTSGEITALRIEVVRLAAEVEHLRAKIDDNAAGIRDHQHPAER